jgi:hypothetical protein
MNLTFAFGILLGLTFATVVCIVLAYLWFLRARRKVAVLKRDILLRANANDAYNSAMRRAAYNTADKGDTPKFKRQKPIP